MKQLKRSISALLVLAMVISSFIVRPLEVNAEEKPSVFFEDYCEYYFPDMSTKSTTISGLEKDAKVSLKSSNKKVVSVKYDKKSNTVLMSPKKAGKATITCKIKQNGKTYTSKCKWTLLKYQNPFAKFKIGSKDYTKKFNKTNNCSIKISYKARKLEIKMKKGYKITRLYKRPYLYMWEKIKNGRKIKIGSNEGIIIYFKDKEGHELQAGLDNI
jgi:Bacterial Ig-like domain (group 2).